MSRRQKPISRQKARWLAMTDAEKHVHYLKTRRGFAQSSLLYSERTATGFWRNWTPDAEAVARAQKNADAARTLIESIEEDIEFAANYTPPEPEPEPLTYAAQYNRRMTAIHEAGHAVVAWVLGIKFSKITIEPEGYVRSNENLAGYVHFPSTTLRDRDLTHTLAGGIAEQRFTGSDLTAYEDRLGADRETIAEAQALHDDSPAEQAKRLFKETRQARRMVEEHWATIETLANVLVERKCLTGREATAVIRSKSTRRAS